MSMLSRCLIGGMAIASSKAKTKKVEPFDIFCYFILIIVTLVMLLPVWYCIAGSFNDGTDYLRGGVYFWPREFTAANCKAVFRDSSIFRAFEVTIAKSINYALEYLHVHYVNSTLSMNDVAAHVSLSYSHFSSLFRKDTGTTVPAYLRKYRIEKAIE